MSNRNPDTDYGLLPTMLQFVLQQFRRTLSTCMPSRLRSFDRASRRAVMEDSIKVRMTSGEEKPRAPTADVPIIFPGGGGYILTFPLQAGDQLLRVANERGLSEFKRTFAEASPDAGSFLEAKDAVALPGFGPLSITPAGEGAVLQTVDGSVYIEVHDDRIKVVKGSQTIELDDAGLRADITGDVTVEASGDITAEAGGTATVEAPSIVLDGNVRITGTLNVSGSSVRHGSKEIGQTHTHTAVQPGGGVSGPPV